MVRRKSLVQDVMTTDVVTVGPDASLLDAYDLMSDNGVRRLPVVDKDELLGIVTLSDILREIPALLAEADRQTRLMLTARKVREVMTSDPIAIYADDTIQDAAERMLENEVSGLPVIQGQEVIGIITESDIFRLVVESWSDE